MSFPSFASLRQSFRQNWLSYLAEAMGVLLFMIASCLTSVIMHHPASPVRQFIGDSQLLQRTVQALVIGVFILFINLNPLGKKSGSHINPAVTLSYRYLGKITAADAVWYILFQCVSAALAGILFAQLLKPWYAHPDVNYNLSAPKPPHTWVAAVVAEFIISTILIFVTLISLHSQRFSKASGYFGTLLIMLYVIFEAPFSGMSTNPARSLGTAVGAGDFTYYWIYVVVPLSAMLLTTYIFDRYWLYKPNSRSWRHVDKIPPVFPVDDPEKA